MAEARKATSGLMGERLGSSTLIFGPGLAFWFWCAYQVNQFGLELGVHNVTEALNYWLRLPYGGSHGVLATLLLALLHLVFSIYLWLSALVSAPVAAAIIAVIYAVRKSGALLIAWARTSLLGAVVTSLLALSAAYLVFNRSGAAAALWRGFERVLGSVAGRRRNGGRKAMMKGQPEDQTEATLRASITVLQGQIQGLGITIPAVPGKPTLWGGWIDSVSARVQMERQTKVATSVLECLKVVNDCYRQWKDYQQLRQDVEHIEETKKLNDMKRQIERQELELKLTLENELKRHELKNKLKEAERQSEKLDAEIQAARVQRSVKPETHAQRLLRLDAERVQTLAALGRWEKGVSTRIRSGEPFTRLSAAWFGRCSSGL